MTDEEKDKLVAEVMQGGGLCACYDDKWGLSLNYIAVAKKVFVK